MAPVKVLETHRPIGEDVEGEDGGNAPEMGDYFIFSAISEQRAHLPSLLLSDCPLRLLCNLVLIRV